jgi:hypothetical protein
LTPSWHALIETTFIGIMEQALRTTPLMRTMSSGGGGGGGGGYQGDALLSKHILAVFCVLGGHIEAPYRNCPVVFQRPHPSAAAATTASLAFSTNQASDSSSSSSSKDLLIGVFVDFILISILIYLLYIKLVGRIVGREAPNLKECPHCCGKINAAAKKCPFCTGDIIVETRGVGSKNTGTKNRRSK